MKNSKLKSEICELRNEVFDVEQNFIEYSTDIESREAKWKTAERKIEDLIQVNKETCILNVGGKKFQVALHTLKSRKGTKFYKQLLRKEIKKDSETFYDRDYDFFQIILHFLRTGKLKAEHLSEEQKEDLLQEAQYFEINYIIETLKATAAEVEFNKVEIGTEYKNNGEIVGTNIAKDLKDKTLLKGSCSNSPGLLTIHLNREVEFETIDIGGYNGNSLAWYVGNGKGASIQTSLDNINWAIVGVVPNEFGHIIIPVKLSRSKAKYIRFTHHDFMGLGFLEIKEAKKK